MGASESAHFFLPIAKCDILSNNNTMYIIYIRKLLMVQKLFYVSQQVMEICWY